MNFSRPENDWTDASRGKIWVSICDEGGALKGPSKADVQRQIEYWLNRPDEWKNWIIRKSEGKSWQSPLTAT